MQRKVKITYGLMKVNDLNQIANIYLGMKESGWEPTAKISTIPTFSIEGGENLQITKTQI